MSEFITKDSGKRQDYASGMRRDTQENKPRYDLIYMPMLKRLAELHGRGVVKYGERNFENADSVQEYERFKQSALRHMFQWFNGDLDEDHASAVLFNINAAEMVKDKIDITEEMIEEYRTKQSLAPIEDGKKDTEDI